jgi:NADH:ubiquinone oxidoreductase subunit 4 (subunit M)
LDHGLEINLREAIAIAPLLALMLVIGVWPAWILEVINTTVVRLFG